MVIFYDHCHGNSIDFKILLIKYTKLTAKMQAKISLWISPNNFRIAVTVVNHGSPGILGFILIRKNPCFFQYLLLLLPHWCYHFISKNLALNRSAPLRNQLWRKAKSGAKILVSYWEGVFAHLWVRSAVVLSVGYERFT